MSDSIETTDVPAEQAGDAGRSAWSRIGLVILRLLLVAALGITLGAALYFGVPALVRAWTEPVQANRAQIGSLSAELEALQSEQADKLDAQAERVAELEGALATSREHTAELESQLARLEGELSDLEAKQREVARLATRVDALDSELVAAQDSLDELKTLGPAAQQRVSALELRFQWIRTMELLSRARVEALRDNYGLAEENLAQANDTLQALLADSSGTERDVLEVILGRLALAQEELPASPDLAADDMETAWRQLVELSAVTDAGLADGP